MVRTEKLAQTFTYMWFPFSVCVLQLCACQACHFSGHSLYNIFLRTISSWPDFWNLVFIDFLLLVYRYTCFPLTKFNIEVNLFIFYFTLTLYAREGLPEKEVVE